MLGTPTREPLQIGFIGGGLNSAVGYTHFNASRLDGYFRVVAGSFSRDPAQNQATAKAYGVSPERTHDDWRDLLNRERGQLDAIVILTPTPSHADMVITALELGHAVISEKALGISQAECDAIGAAVTRTGGFLAVTFNYSGYPMIRELRGMIAAGALGKLQQIHIEMPQEGFLRQSAKPQAWRLEDHFVPTVSLDLGVHVHHLVDFISSGLHWRSANAEHASYGPFPGIVDNVYCRADYEEGVKVQAWWGKTALGYRNGLRIRAFGSTGSAEWFQMTPETLVCADNTGRTTTIDRGTSATEVATQLRYHRFKAGHPSGFIEAFANLYNDIAESLHAHREGTPTPQPMVYGWRQASEGMAFLEELSRSAGTKYMTDSDQPSV